MSNNELTPQQKRLLTIKARYGSVKNMLSRRDVRDLILAGYNGGKHYGKKGFATWQEGRLSKFAQARQRDNKGRFLPEEET